MTGDRPVDLLAEAVASLGAARRLGDRRREGDALISLGNALQAASRSNKAITAYQDAATIFRETGDRNDEAATLSNLGLALLGARRPDEAITAHQDAAAIFRETGDEHNERIALESLERARAAHQA